MAEQDKAVELVEGAANQEAEPAEEANDESVETTEADDGRWEEARMLYFVVGMVIVIVWTVILFFIFQTPDKADDAITCCGVNANGTSFSDGTWTGYGDAPNWWHAWGSNLWVSPILGLLLASQGIGKFTHPVPYFDDVGDFQTGIPGPVLGVFMMILEMFCGPIMMVGPLYADVGMLHLIGTWGSAVDIFVYATLSTQAWARGIAFHLNCLECPPVFTPMCDRPVANCTCFGIYGAQKLSWFVLIQDIIVAFETWYAVSALNVWIGTCTLDDKVCGLRS